MEPTSRSLAVQLVVIAKAPIPGKVKTRLSPPCTAQDAAWIAEAGLKDTLTTVLATPCLRRVLSLDGEPGTWLPSGYAVVAQRGDGLDHRLANTFDDCFSTNPAPVVIIGMDTPQVTPTDLVDAARSLLTGLDGDDGPRAVIGPASDGGYWLIGLSSHLPDAVRGVAMSEPTTGAAQHLRLLDLGYRVASLRELRDVDTFDDAQRVAAEIPTSQFRRAVDSVDLSH